MDERYAVTSVDEYVAEIYVSTNIQNRIEAPYPKVTLNVKEKQCADFRLMKMNYSVSREGRSNVTCCYVGPILSN